jgi:hypothetical protein
MHSIASSSSSFPPGLRGLVPAPSHPSPANLLPPIPLLQYLCKSCQVSAPTPCSVHLRTSSQQQGLASNDQARTESEPIKLPDRKMEAITNLFRGQAWFFDPAEEPPIKPDDPFVLNGYIPSTAKSRFNAFVCSNPNGGKSHCRIKHYVEEDGEEDGNGIECSYKSAHDKDVIAHVCDHLNYKPYKCQGKGNHEAW